MVTLCLDPVSAAPRVRFVKMHQAQHVRHGTFPLGLSVSVWSGLNSGLREL